jgi:hypothetical protein
MGIGKPTQRGFDLISEALPFGRLWYAEPNASSNAVGYAKFSGRFCCEVARKIWKRVKETP